MANRFFSGAYTLAVATTGSTVAGNAASALNPEGVAVIVTHAIADLIGASSSSGSSVTVGFSSAAASTATVLLFDTLATSAVGVFSNASSGNAGTGGVISGLWSSGGYLTVTHTAAQGASLNMNLVVEYEIRST